MTRHLFILNPKAGVKSPIKHVTEEIRRAFILNTDREEEKYDVVLTEYKGHATEIASRACEENPGFTIIYACGGDGTLHEVVNGVAEKENVAVCPVPVGSGNDFVRYFEGYTKEDFTDISALIHGQEISCDLLRCGNIYSINSISAGLDAYTNMRQQKVKKLPLVSGGAAYKLALGYSFFSSMKNPIRFEVDGKEILLGDGYVSLAVAANGKWYGGGFKATPLAEINDGQMDFLAVPTISRMEFLKYVGDYKRGDHLKTMPKVFYTKCKKIKMISDQPLCLQADGENFYQENPEIEILPASLRLILPRIKEEKE